MSCENFQRLGRGFGDDGDYFNFFRLIFGDGLGVGVKILVVFWDIFQIVLNFFKFYIQNLKNASFSNHKIPSFFPPDFFFIPTTSSFLLTPTRSLL